MSGTYPGPRVDKSSAAEFEVAGLIRGPNDGTGIVVGKPGAGAGTGSTFQVPTFTAAQQASLVPGEGMVVFNSTDAVYEVYSAAVWQRISLSKLGEDFILQSEARTTRNATRVAQTTYEGSSYRTPAALVFNRLVLRLTAGSFPTDLQVAFFQIPGGVGTGTAARIATCNFTPGAPGNFTVALVEGTVRLQAGTFFVLFGRRSAGGSGTFRTYTVAGNDLLNTNVAVGTHPVSFNTAIAVATVAPATFNPVASATATTNNVAPVLRTRLV